jgi:hypothetical protein
MPFGIFLQITVGIRWCAGYALRSGDHTAQKLQPFTRHVAIHAPNLPVSGPLSARLIRQPYSRESRLTVQSSSAGPEIEARCWHCPLPVFEDSRARSGACAGAEGECEGRLSHLSRFQRLVFDLQILAFVQGAYAIQPTTPNITRAPLANSALTSDIYLQLSGSRRFWRLRIILVREHLLDIRRALLQAPPSELGH